MKYLLMILLASLLTGCAWNKSLKIGEAEGHGIKVKDLELKIEKPEDNKIEAR